MTRHLVTCLAIVALSLVSPTPAAATTLAFGDAVYDTVDAIEVLSGSGVTVPSITITGIISGQSAPSQLTYRIESPTTNTNADGASRCDRLALLAMSKPGKFQLAMNTSTNSFATTFNCKLIVRTP